MEIGISQAHQAKLPLYLETMTQSNVDYYIKRGFEIGDQYVVADEVPIWSMVNKPQ